MSTEEIQSIRDSLQRIETALVGDNLGNEGVVKRLGKVEAKVEAQDRRLLLWSGIVAGVSVVVTHFKAKLFP